MRKGELERENARLGAANQQLATDLENMRTDPYYQIAVNLGWEVVQILSSGGVAIDQRVDEAIGLRREIIYDGQLEALAGQEIERRLAEQRGEIEAEARVEADRRAANALAYFMEHEAEGFKLATLAQLEAEKSDALIREAKQQLAKEARDQALLAARQKLEVANIEAREQEQNKAVLKLRAQEIRTRTKDSEVLPLDLLKNGDVITLTFVDPGNGHEPLTESYYGTSAYRTTLERRKLILKLTDVHTGTIEVQKDSWLNQDGKREVALRGGRQLTVSAEVPDEHTDGPALVKAFPLILRNGNQERVGDSPLELWWVNLGDYRILS